MISFEEVVKFHGHACPGLAFGFRVSQLALRELAFDRSRDEELVAVVENNSCAVDAIQAMCGCTFGKGNLIFRDYGKQVYSFFKRPLTKSLRIAVKWQMPAESAEDAEAWSKFSAGNRSPEVMQLVQACKALKMKAILAAEEDDLFDLSRPEDELPARAVIYASVRCDICGEKAMASRIKEEGGRRLCVPCSEKDK